MLFFYLFELFIKEKKISTKPGELSFSGEEELWALVFGLGSLLFVFLSFFFLPFFFVYFVFLWFISGRKATKSSGNEPRKTRKKKTKPKNQSPKTKTPTLLHPEVAARHFGRDGDAEHAEHCRGNVYERAV